MPADPAILDDLIARGPVEIMVQNEGFLELLSDAIQADGGNIQGFLYADHHVIRDVSKPWSQQEIWRRSGEYDETHAAMMRQIEIEKLRKAVKRAFAMMERPFPHQERAAESARASLRALRTQETTHAD